jgi:hypothetical protein
LFSFVGDKKYRFTYSEALDAFYAALELHPDTEFERMGAGVFVLEQTTAPNRPSTEARDGAVNRLRGRLREVHRYR